MKDIRPSASDSTMTLNCRNDYNILELADKILLILNSEKKKKISQLTEELSDLRTAIKKEYINRMQSQINRIKDIEKELSDINSDTLIKSFQEETKNILSEYSSLGPLKVKKVFGKKGISETEAPEKRKKRIGLITEFFMLSEKYVPLDVIWSDTDASTCFKCGYDIAKLMESESESDCYCPGCGLEIKSFRKWHSEDSSSEYEDLSNFIKKMDHYVGREKIKFSPGLFESLDKYFSGIGIPTGKEIKLSVPKIDGRRAIVFNKDSSKIILSRNDMRKALNKTGFNDYYKNVNLICHQYWDWDLPSLDDQRDKLIDHYKKTEAVFKTIKDKDKKATINTDWRLENHLKILGYPYKSDDFKQIDTRHILEYYDSIWEIMCSRSGDPEIKYIKNTS